MFKKILFFVLSLMVLVSCSKEKEQLKTVKVQRGNVLNSTVTDSSGQTAKWNINTNSYTFENDILYPVFAKGGFIDLDDDGIKNNDDFELDIELKTSKGNNLTILSTIVYDENSEDENKKTKILEDEFGFSKNEIYSLVSNKKELALFSNLVYKNIKINENIKTSNLIELIKNNKINLKQEFDNFDLKKYDNLSSIEFFKVNEKDTIEELNEIEKIKKSISSYNGLDISSTNILNAKSTYIPPQCYTKTVDENNNVSNPCYACHINSKEPNFIDDWDLQESYAFSDNSKKNPYLNSFKNRSYEVSKISDDEILEYINKDNYKDENGNIILASKLKYDLPKQWDLALDGKKDGIWSGFVPDCYFNFDDEGFDKDNEGNFTGWRVFAYQPFLGTFWPTNGSTDDVIIRLPKSMMQDKNEMFSKEVYKINFAIVESMIKKTDIKLGFEVDESKYDVDLNHNGIIDKTSTIVYKWNKPDMLSSYPKVIYNNFYVGLAKEKLILNELHISPGLYPNGTEFLHSVRYIGIKDDKSGIKLASRMKELRYAKKTSWNNYTQLDNAASAEIKERDAFPDRLRTIKGNIEDGLQTGLGWTYQGFIEDVNGDLRPQSYEETLSCIGCHSGVGVNTDSTFAFPRKFNISNSWYHWSKKDLVGQEDLMLSNGESEFVFYLKQNKAGDEFRVNDEIKNKFFDEAGNLIDEEIEKIKNDISYLIYPSINRAISLNKAYKVIVDEQSYIYGKDAHIHSLEKSVYKEVEIDKSTKINAIKF